MRTARLLLALLIATVAGTLQAGAAYGQAGSAASRSLTTRAELEGMLARRGTTDDQVDLIRARLGEGDFQVGDRVRLEVPGHPELTDTFTVEPPRLLVLPGGREIPLTGILRSEIASHVANEIAPVIPNATVRARTYLRLSILGAVSQPGFYLVPAESAVTDAIMQAGGPLQQAKMADARIERGNATIIDDDAFAAATAQATSLDRLGLRSGDTITIPGTGQGFWPTARNALMIAMPILYVVLWKIL